MPSSDTYIGSARGPKPGKPPGAPRIGKRRASRLRTAAAIARAVAPDFTGNPKEYLYAVLRGEIAFDPGRVSVADKLARLEPPTEERGPSLVDLVAEAHASVPPPPKELPPQVDAFTATMLRLANDEFEAVLARMDRIAHAARIDGDMLRVRKIERERREAVDSWNEAARREQAKLAE